MRLRDLVLMSRGPQIRADLREAEITRLPKDHSSGQIATTAAVPMDSAYLFDRDSLGRYIELSGVTCAASGMPEVTLEPCESVLIMGEPNFELQRPVQALGELRFTGRYALRDKSERIADLVEHIRVFSPRAHPEGIRFIRALNSAGRFNIDLPRALRDRNSTENVILQPADSILLPEYQPSHACRGSSTHRGACYGGLVAG